MTNLPDLGRVGAIGSALEGVDDPFPVELAKAEARRWESGLGRGARRDVSFPLMTMLRSGDTKEVERRSTSGAHPSLGVERREDSL